MPSPSTPRATRSTRARFAAALVCALALAGCGGSPADVAPHVEGAPDALEFSWSAAEAGTTTALQLRGSTVVVRRVQTGRSGVRVDSTMVVPTSEAWARFLAAADDAGVRAWRSGYLAESFRDGAAWNLRIVVDGQVLESGGANAYPDRAGVEHEVHFTNEFTAFLAALDELTGQRIP